MKTILNFCKKHKLKFIKKEKNKFIASQKISLFAGMSFTGLGEIKYTPIKKVGTKIIYREFLIYPDNDIVDNGKINMN